MAELIRIEPIPSGARFSLRLRESAAVPGLKLDLAINRCAQIGTRLCARLGPDEWWMVAPAAEREAVADEVQRALGDRFYSWVDISDRDVAFNVSGPRARDVINGGCPLDLHDSAFPAGSATRTILSKTEIVIFRPDAATSYRIECRRSLAQYTQGLLETIARECVTP